VFRVGETTVSGFAANTNHTGPWTTFSSPYSSVPQLVVSMRSSGVGDPWVNVTHTGLSSSGFYPCIYRTNTFNCICDWMAVGGRPALLLRSAAREQVAAFNDVGRYVFYIQTPQSGSGHEIVEAIDKKSDEITGVLRLFNESGSVVKEYGPGEWFSAQREYLM